MPTTESTLKFKADISDLKRGIQDANRQIKLANAEFKAASSGMGDWAHSADGIQAKLTQLDRVLDSQKAILSSYEKQLELVTAEYGENSKEADEMRIKVANQQAAVNKTSAEVERYRSALDDLEQEQKDATDATKKQGSAYDDLKSKIDTQEQELSDLKTKYKDIILTEGENSESAKKLGTEITDLNADLKKNKDALKQADDAADEFDEGMDEAGDSATTFSEVLKANVLSDFIREGFELLKNAVQELASAMRDAVFDAIEYGDEINTLSQRTGLSTEALQEYYYMQGLVDVSVETITGSLAKLTRNMNSARDGTGNAAEAFEMLGISVTDADGELRPAQDVFDEVIDALGEMTNETERDAAAMSLFGRSAMELNPLIETGSEAIQAFRDEAHEMGYVLSEEDVQALRETQDSLDRFHNQLDTIKRMIATALTPVIERVADAFIEWAQTVDWDFVIDKIMDILDVVGQVINFIIDHHETILRIIGLITAAILAWKAAQLLLNIVMNANPLMLIITLIGMLVTAIIAIEKKTHIFSEFFKAVWEGIKTVVQTVVNAIIGFFQRAWDIITTIWSAITGFFRGIWEGIKAVFMAVGQFFYDRFMAGFNAVKAIWSAVTGFFQSLWEGIKNIFSHVGEFFRSVFEGAKNIVSTIINAIVGVIKLPINGIISLINVFIRGLNRIRIPDWVPLVGGRGIHLNELPLLASGAVLERGQVGLLEGSGAEAVVPLENNRKWIAATVRDLRAELEAQGMIGSPQTNQVTNNTYNFNQTNNSPKALSRLEIYRQTENQLAFARGGL